MMKLITVLFVMGLMMACDNGSEPFPSFLQPALYEEEDYKKEFIYNDARQLVQIRMTTEFNNGGTMTSTQNFSYLPDGNLKESTSDTGFRFVYTYSDGKITRTDEYVNGAWSKYHSFTYDDRGRLVEMITYQDIPEEGGIIPTSKDTYQYDDNNNLAVMRMYYYTSNGAEAKLQTTFISSDYDNRMNTVDAFDVNIFNPYVILRTNNPGKLITQNASGSMTSTDTYTYQFDANGYVTNRTTHTTWYHGDSGSYTSTYTFK